MIISGSSKERSVVVDHNAFLKHDVGIKCFLTCGDDAVCSFCFVIECETLDVSDSFFATLVMLGNDFFICIPDRCLYSITRHYFHQVYRMLYIGIQREELQDGIQDLRNAMSVTADGDGIFPMDSTGKFPSAITRRSLCPISHKTFSNSGDKISGIPFNIVHILLRSLCTYSISEITASGSGDQNRIHGFPKLL